MLSPFLCGGDRPLPLWSSSPPLVCVPAASLTFSLTGLLLINQLLIEKHYSQQHIEGRLKMKESEKEITCKVKSLLPNKILTVEP